MKGATATKNSDLNDLLTPFFAVTGKRVSKPLDRFIPAAAEPVVVQPRKLAGGRGKARPAQTEDASEDGGGSSSAEGSHGSGGDDGSEEDGTGVASSLPGRMLARRVGTAKASVRYTEPVGSIFTPPASNKRARQPTKPFSPTEESSTDAAVSTSASKRSASSTTAAVPTSSVIHSFKLTTYEEMQRIAELSKAKAKRLVTGLSKGALSPLILEKRRSLPPARFSPPRYDHDAAVSGEEAEGREREGGVGGKQPPQAAAPAPTRRLAAAVKRHSSHDNDDEDDGDEDDVAGARASSNSNRRSARASAASTTIPPYDLDEVAPKLTEYDVFRQAEIEAQRKVKEGGVAFISPIKSRHQRASTRNSDEPEEVTTTISGLKYTTSSSSGASKAPKSATSGTVGEARRSSKVVFHAPPSDVESVSSGSGSADEVAPKLTEYDVFHQAEIEAQRKVKEGGVAFISPIKSRHQRASTRNAEEPEEVTTTISGLKYTTSSSSGTGKAPKSATRDTAGSSCSTASAAKPAVQPQRLSLARTGSGASVSDDDEGFTKKGAKHGKPKITGATASHSTSSRTATASTASATQARGSDGSLSGHKRPRLTVSTSTASASASASHEPNGLMDADVDTGGGVDGDEEPTAVSGNVSKKARLQARQLTALGLDGEEQTLHQLKHVKEAVALREKFLARVPDLSTMCNSGYSFMLYGLGSKRELAKSVAARLAPDIPVIIADGLVLEVTGKAVLENVESFLGLRVTKQGSASSSSSAVAAYYSSTSSSSASGASDGVGDGTAPYDSILQAARPIYLASLVRPRGLLLIHSADVLVARDASALATIQAIAADSRLRVLLTVENWKFSQLFDNRSMIEGKWLTLDATTYERYTVEVQALKLEASVGAPTGGGLRYVLQSMTPNSRLILRELLDLVSKEGTKGAVAFESLLRACADGMLGDESKVNHALGELVDHHVVTKNKKIVKLLIPIEEITAELETAELELAGRST